MAGTLYPADIQGHMEGAGSMSACKIERHNCSARATQQHVCSVNIYRYPATIGNNGIKPAHAHRSTMHIGCWT